MDLSEIDIRLLDALADGLAVCERPYRELGQRVGLSERAVIERLAALRDAGIIRRFGVIVDHRALGYTANAMVVWDIADEDVGEAGRRLADQDGVGLCYQRPRRLPEWPYNLFAMIHGRDRRAVLSRIEAIAAACGLEDAPRAVLFSRRRFKQCGARYPGLAA